MPKKSWQLDNNVLAWKMHYYDALYPYLQYIISQYGKNANVFFKNISKNVRISQDMDGKAILLLYFID